MNSPNVTRRKFLRQAAYAGAIAATAGTTIVATRRLARQRQTSAALEKNPFAYDVGAESKTDPRLVAYRPLTRFPAPRADTRRIACGADDRIYVAAGNYVSVLDASGATLNEIALPSAARCVAVGDDSLIYIGLRDRIEVFSSKGQRQSSWDSVAPRSWFTGIAVSENELFVADAGSRVILRYDLAGKLTKRLGEKDSAKNIPGFIIPSPYFDVKLASDGLLRVTNPGRHQVEAYTRDGDFEFAWGKTTTAIEGFCGCCNPIGIVLLPGNRCVTCEKGLPRVKVYSGQGQLESVVAGPEMFASEARAIDDESAPAIDAAVDSRGRVFILDIGRNEIRVMERKTTV
jgi:hypothetical protein